MLVTYSSGRSNINARWVSHVELFLENRDKETLVRTGWSSEISQGTVSRSV